MSLEEVETQREKALADYIGNNAWIIYDWYEGQYAYLEKEKKFYFKGYKTWLQTHSIPATVVLELLKMKENEQKKILQDSPGDTGNQTDSDPSW